MDRNRAVVCLKKYSEFSEFNYTKIGSGSFRLPEPILANFNYLTSLKKFTKFAKFTKKLNIC